MADAVTESGVNPGNDPFAGDPSATGNVLSNDTDVDAGAVLKVSQVNGDGTKVGVSVTGTYGSVTIADDGSWTYTLDNADPDTNKLAQGQAATDVFTYTVTDEHGATVLEQPDHQHHRDQRRAGCGGGRQRCRRGDGVGCEPGQ